MQFKFVQFGKNLHICVAPTGFAGIVIGTLETVTIQKFYQKHVLKFMIKLVL